MKTKNAILTITSVMILTLITIFACEQKFTPEEIHDLQTMPVKSECTQIEIGQIQGNTYIMSIDSADLKSCIQSYFSSQVVDTVYIEEDAGNIWLKGQTRDGIDFAFQLFENGNELLLSNGGSSQSCTSVTPCSGCKLTIFSPLSGTCTCLSCLECYPFPGKCTHTVTSTSTELVACLCNL